MKINESLTRVRDQNIVKINIPELDKVDKYVHEAIHNEYNAQIIDNDIFIKVSFIPEVYLHLLLNLINSKFYIISMTEEIKKEFNAL
jgi:hypothetical protein